MIELVWDTMQVVDSYYKAYLRHDASCWSIWQRLFETPCKLLIYMKKVISDSMQVLDIYDQDFLGKNAISWDIW